MFRILLFCSGLLLSTNVIVAQDFANVTWVQPGTWSNGIGRILLDSNQNIINFVDFSDSIRINGVLIKRTKGSNGVRSVLVKTDPENNIIWMKQFSAYLTRNAIDRDDNIYLCGVFTDSLFIDNIFQFLAQSPVQLARNLFIAKLNPNGNLLWIKKMFPISESASFEYEYTQSLEVKNNQV